MPLYKTVKRNENGKLVYTYSREKNQEYRKSSTIPHKRQQAKRNARNKGLEFTLTTKFLEELWVTQEGKCALSQRPLGAIGDGSFSPSIDRVNPLFGYTPDNVQWVIWRVNDAKSNMSNEDFVQLCKDIAASN